jgi:hypothetical protein
MGIDRCRSLAAGVGILICVAGGLADAQTGTDEPEQHQAMSNDQIAKQLSNPISNLYSLQVQTNLTLQRGSSRSYRGEFTTNFQPALPLHLTDDWNLIVRPVFNFTSTVVPTRPAETVDQESGAVFISPFERAELDRTAGIGQTSVIALLSPRKGRLLWGVGPTAIIPTTTRDALSQRKYSLGPAGVILNMTEKWVYGVFPQYWWSVSGSDRRLNVSQANIQYFVWRSLGDGWQLGMSPNISYNRKASGPNAWQVPIGLGVQKTTRFGKMPVKFSLESQYYVVHTDDFGPRWNIRFAITPVIPALIKRNLF